MKYAFLKDRLDNMLQHYPFPALNIVEQVDVTLMAQPAQLSDTDESVEREKQSVLGITPQKFTSKFSVGQSETLLNPSEINHTQSSDQITKD